MTRENNHKRNVIRELMSVKRELSTPKMDKSHIRENLMNFSYPQITGFLSNQRINEIIFENFSVGESKCVTAN